MKRAKTGSPPYFVLLGSIIGMLVAGVVVPLAAGTPSVDVAAGDLGLPLESGSDAFSDLDGVDGEGSEIGTDGEPTDGSAVTSDASAQRAAGGPTADGSESAPGSSGRRSAGADGAGGSLPASDQGVTSDSIEVGVMILDLGGLSTVGISVPGADPDQQRLAWDAWIADMNERGGINGRKIEVFYRNYDLLDEDDQRAACLDMKDRKVFAVFDAGGMNPPGVLCVTQENKIPMIALGGQGFADVLYQRANGLLFTTFAAGSRSIANTAHELHRRGDLKGKKIGVLTQDGPGVQETIQRGLFDTLDELGYDVAHHYDLAADASTSSSQIPVAVQEMRTRQVDTVLLLTTVLPATQFVQYAEKQAWFPRYWMGDWGGAYSDVYVGNMPQSFDGHLITTVRTGEWRVGTPEPGPAASCRSVYEKRTGQKLDVSTAEYAFTLRGCTMMKIFEAAAARAGADLTRPRLSQGIQGLGPVPLATFGGGSFRGGKFDAADLVRRADYAAGCRCWMPTGSFVQGHER